MNYVKGLDTLRAFAVFFVIISHWGSFFPAGSAPDLAIRMLVPSGQFGVTLFFVLSGFLITSILLSERYKQQVTGGHRGTIIKSFFIRRSLRIFPIYYLTIFVLLLVGLPYLRSHAAYYLLYLGNIPPYRENSANSLIHLWSLAVEEQFYLVWPWIILFVREKYLKQVFIWAIVIGVVSKYVVLYMLHHDFAMLVINCFDAFGLGGLYAYMRTSAERTRRFDKAYSHILIATLFIGWMLTPFRGVPVGQMFSRALECIVSLGLIIFVLNNRYAWVKEYILENRVLNYIGRISYGLYLYHYVLDGYCDAFLKRVAVRYPSIPAWMHGHAAEWCFRFAVLFVVCWASYRFIEQPLLGLKKRFKYS